MDLSGLPAGGQVFLQEPPPASSAGPVFKKTHEGTFWVSSDAKLELPSVEQCCYSWIFFFSLNVATLVMVTVGSVRSKTGHHSYTRGSQRHSNTSYIWPLQFLDWFWLLRLFLMIYDDKNWQRLTAEIQKCFRQSENSRASEHTRIPCLSCSSFQSFFLKSWWCETIQNRKLKSSEKKKLPTKLTVKSFCLNSWCETLYF